MIDQVWSCIIMIVKYHARIIMITRPQSGCSGQHRPTLLYVLTGRQGPEDSDDIVDDVDDENDEEYEQEYEQKYDENIMTIWNEYDENMNNKLRVYEKE